MVMIVDVGELDEDNDPYLPFGLRVMDAREKFRLHYEGQSFYIRLNFKRQLWFCTRTSGYETDWDYDFKVSKEEAREIVSLGYARWHESVPEKLR